MYLSKFYVYSVACKHWICFTSLPFRLESVSPLSSCILVHILFLLVWHLEVYLLKVWGALTKARKVQNQNEETS